MEALSGILSGAGCGYEAEKKGNGIFFQAIDVEGFMPVAEFKRRIDNLIQAAKSSKLRPGFDEILIPGEPELRTEKKRLEDGIYVPEKTWEEMKSVGMKLGFDLVSVADSQ